jgi:MFS family permease
MQSWKADNSGAFALIATMAMQVMVSLAAVTVPVFAPAAAVDVGISPIYIGLFVALVYGAGMGASLLSGGAIHKYGPFRVSQLCLLSCALGLGAAATGSALGMAAAAVLLGFGNGAVTPASSHILSQNTAPHRLPLVFSVKQTGGPLGGALAGLCVPAMVSAAGWRAAALLISGLCLAVAVVTQSLRVTFDAERQPAQRLCMADASGPLRTLLADRGLRVLALSSFFFAALQLCLLTYLVTYLATEFGFSLQQAGATLALTQIAGVIGRIAWGVISTSWIRPLRVFACLACAMPLTMAGLALFPTSAPAWGLIVVTALCGATTLGWNGVFLAEVARQAPPGKAGVATGAALFFTYFGVCVGPTLFSLLLAAGLNFRAVYLMSAAPVLLFGLKLLTDTRLQSPYKEA